MTPKRADSWRAWGVSIIFHAVLLLSLSLVVWHKAAQPWQPMIESRISEPDPVPESFVPEINLQDFLKKSGEPAKGEKTDDLLAAAPLAGGSNLLGTVGAPWGTGGPGSGGGGDGDGGIIAGEKGMGFFGSKAKGNSVVFVVDMSGSMEGIRFIRAQQELVRAIHQLHVTQKFYVVFFNKQAVPLFFPRPTRGMVAATPAMKRSATRWIVERHPSAGTEPEEALVLALGMKPEVIYFLTDGEFPERCREVCKEKNTYGAVIHTIALQSREGIPLLEAIAQDHHGTFKLVQ
jgi:hypothetical protein